MGVKPQPCYNRIPAINDRVIMRLQCISLPLAIGTLFKGMGTLFK